MDTDGSSAPHQAGRSRGSTTSSSNCSRCNPGQAENTRNLVVCIDGTSNQFGQNNTNVMKLFDMVDLEATQPKQYAYYSSGIGTRPKSSGILRRMKEATSDIFDKAVAWNIDKNIKDAYGWLAGKYQEGDRIYLFGFSRGAYQVRVLAGMIHEVGLLRTSTEKQISTAYHHYNAIQPGNPEAKQAARKFKKTFSWRDLKVHFIGAWDTVSSVGLERGDISPSVPASACHIRHALALDERRVKFVPEYFREINSQTPAGKSRYVVSSLNVECTPTPAKEPHESISDGGTCTNENQPPDVTEVWFPGCHSDVGGKDRIGKFRKVGNISLLWMRREAIAHGLVLQPTDMTWASDDIDFGVGNSMTRAWKVPEYLAIRHRVSNSGSGECARSMHRLEPRHIMPGQKVHASILYANAYKPQATWGSGYDIPMIYARPQDTELDERFWEAGLFCDSSEAKELMNALYARRAASPVCLDKLLFVLRFKKGSQCIRNVPDWQKHFTSLVRDRGVVPIVRLVAFVAYFEASCDPEANLHGTDSMQDIFDEVKRCLGDILVVHKHPDRSRAIITLEFLTKHQILRQHILTSDLLNTLVKIFDEVVLRPDRSFGRTMDGLNALLQHEDTRKIIVEKLGENHPKSNMSRLSRMLETDDLYLLTSVLRMVWTLARIPEARGICNVAKARIRKIATTHGGIIGPLAVEILLALYIHHEQGQLDVRDLSVRENLVSALGRVEFSEHDSAEGQCREPALRCLFELYTTELTREKKIFIGELKKVVRGGNARERTAATMTLLKLCEARIVRDYLMNGEVGLLDDFVHQLQQKETALLAAYALATCMRNDDMQEFMNQNQDLPKYIVGMLRLDYFDDAVGQVEGFQIFGNLMQYDHLRKEIKRYDITEVLETKLAKGASKEVRTSLICLEIFHSFDQDGPWTRQLVQRGLNCLRNPAWKDQKAGVTILSALALTEHGKMTIKHRIHEIIEMLLVKCDSRNQQTRLDAMTPTERSDTNVPLCSPSRMMGPACALRNLAQNELLRERICHSTQYHILKHSYLSETLVREKDTYAWRVNTPNRTDVIDMLNNVIKAVDEEPLSEESLMSIEDTLPPNFRHWDRLGALIRDCVVPVVSYPLLLGSSAVVVAAWAPIYLSVRAYEYVLKNHFHVNPVALTHADIQVDPEASLVLPEQTCPGSFAFRK